MEFLKRIRQEKGSCEKKEETLTAKEEKEYINEFTSEGINFNRLWKEEGDERGVMNKEDERG